MQALRKTVFSAIQYRSEDASHAGSVVSIAEHAPEPAKVRVAGITQRYQNGSKTPLTALEDIHVQIRAGEFVCIVGPSGCGKSTLLHMIAGLMKPSEGEVWINDRRVENTGTDRILIFQELGLFPWLTVAQNVEFGMRHGKRMDKRERRARVAEYLKLVHLGQFADSYIHQLSGGMRQRVALARALASEPDVLLMDEPFAALDAQTRDLLHDELEKIWAHTGCTIMFVTHNVREAVRLGDRVLVMTFRPGRIKREFQVNLPRPRSLEDPEVALTARDILQDLREEIDKSLEMEYAR